MYIQNVCLDNNELLSNDKYSLDGITVNNLNRIITIDPTLGTLYDDNDELINKSIYIKHIKLKKDKTLSSSKNYLVDENTFDNLIATAKEQILNTVENIREGKFNISPIHFKNEQTSVCSYCSFSDICNRTNNDVRHIDLAESEDEDEI
jgi:ATP-dependent helicase/DNAse subunit B